ncbi:MAG: 3-methyl-2-oxobutanoate dehydrogenase subunit VorB [Candidatus Scatomorpha sp.]|jgi:2-oxoglutarate ferredoxin oxidoreductase subunit alpha
MATTRFMKGNEAAAEAAIRAGVDGFFGYPLTPSSEILEYMATHFKGVFVQAESEIASINMMMGAAAAGKRVMTGTSGLGLSLMTEGLSYMVGMEVPCVVVDVMRVGPGVGSLEPTQGDYNQLKACGNGGHVLPVYAPSTVQEVADYTAKAFEIADKYRTPVIVATDGSIGQMMESVTFSDEEPVIEKKPWSFEDSTPGHPVRVLRTNYGFAPGSTHWADMFAKYDKLCDELQECEEYMTDDAEIIIIAFGSVARKCKSVIKKAREENINVGMLRPITLVPFPKKVFAKYRNRDCQFLDVEMNYGLMVQDAIVALGSDKNMHFFRDELGLMPKAADILDAIRKVKEV